MPENSLTLSQLWKGLLALGCRDKGLSRVGVHSEKQQIHSEARSTNPSAPIPVTQVPQYKRSHEPWYRELRGKALRVRPNHQLSSPKRSQENTDPVHPRKRQGKYHFDCVFESFAEHTRALLGTAKQKLKDPELILCRCGAIMLS